MFNFSLSLPLLGAQEFATQGNNIGRSYLTLHKVFRKSHWYTKPLLVIVFEIQVIRTKGSRLRNMFRFFFLNVWDFSRVTFDSNELKFVIVIYKFFTKRVDVIKTGHYLGSLVGIFRVKPLFQHFFGFDAHLYSLSKLIWRIENRLIYELSGKNASYEGVNVTTLNFFITIIIFSQFGRRCIPHIHQTELQASKLVCKMS